MTSQQPIPAETREAASKALVELADSMMRASRSLIHKSARVLNPDPKVHGGVLSDLRRYQGFGQPCSNEVVQIEALLAGVPPEQCLTEAEKRRRARQEEKRRWEESSREFQRQQAEERRQGRRELGALIAETVANRMGGERVAEPKGRRIDGNIIEGPWGDAS